MNSASEIYFYFDYKSVYFHTRPLTNRTLNFHVLWKQSLGTSCSTYIMAYNYHCKSILIIVFLMWSIFEYSGCFAAVIKTWNAFHLYFRLSSWYKLLTFFYWNTHLAVDFYISWKTILFQFYCLLFHFQQNYLLPDGSKDWLWSIEFGEQLLLQLIFPSIVPSAESCWWSSIRGNEREMCDER